MLNEIVLQGRLTADPELRRTQGGISVVTFRIACERDFKKDGEQSADFINIVAWRQTAEFISRYFAKGSMILVSGRLQIREYKDKEGQRRSITEVIAERANFAASRRESEPQGFQNMDGNYSPAASPKPDPFAEISDDGELPF